MNTLMNLPVRTLIEGAQYLPLNLCEAADLNHRKRFPKQSLEELADSIEKVGVLQPVVARPKPGAKPGGPQYEIVVGGRRLRGCKIVAARRKENDIAVIPAVVRELSDFDARELACTENLQREDVHPLEEAEGYEDLLKHPVSGGEFSPPRVRGYTVDELAARLGKSRGYVFGRLKLLALLPAGRDSFYEEKIIPSVALLLARMPASVQPEAIKEIAAGWNGAPYTFRQASELLERKYMLKLSAAPFKITDETLVASAGSCRACPKRTGANPDLFGDIKGADVCTDPKCFHGKRDAHQAKLIATAKAEGRDVIVGAAAKKIKPHQFGDMKGFIALDKPNYDVSSSGKTTAQLLGKDAPPVTLLEDPHTHNLVPVIARDVATKLFKSKGLIKTPDKGNSEARRQALAKATADLQWRTEVAKRLLAEVVDDKYDDMDLHSWLLPELAINLWGFYLNNDQEDRARELLGWQDVVDFEKHIRGLNAKQLDQALICMTISEQLSSVIVGKPALLLTIAGRLGVDGARVRADLDAAAKASAQEAKPAAKKAAVKSKSQPPTPASKYLDSATGSTWSGRGLQPKWLKVALAKGKKLSDFDTAASKDPVSASLTFAKGEGGSEKKIESTAKPEEKKIATAKAVGKQKPKTEQKVKPAAPASTITPRGAWPFPTGPRPDEVANVAAGAEAEAQP